MFNSLVSAIEYLWGTPLVILVVGVGLFLTIRTGFFQFLGVKEIWQKTFGELLSKKDQAHVDDCEGELRPAQALSAVLAGTVGSGNIAGVAAAIAIGGPGAVFWMWMIGLVGMITKMVEVTLSVEYRKKGSDGEYYGGPMHYIRQGIHGPTGKVLSAVYATALFLLVIVDACMIQTHTLATSAETVFRIPALASGLLIVGLSMAIILSGGVKKIGAFCAKIVPSMCILYVVGGLIVIGANIANVPEAFAMIFKYAFAPAPAIGGFAGSTVALAIGRGAARGIFSNEAGMGTAATVHATAKTDHPVHQGMYGIIEVFIVTGVVCTITALAILSSGEWYNGNTGVVLTFNAFESVLGVAGTAILGIAVILFTYSSYLGFFIEYRASSVYLFGENSFKYLRFFYFMPPVFAVTMDTEAVWSLADMAVGFIIVPNMIALLILSPKFTKLFREYIEKTKKKKSVTKKEVGA